MLVLAAAECRRKGLTGGPAWKAQDLWRAAQGPGRLGAFGGLWAEPRLCGLRGHRVPPAIGLPLRGAGRPGRSLHRYPGSMDSSSGQPSAAPTGAPETWLESGQSWKAGPTGLPDGLGFGWERPRGVQRALLSLAGAAGRPQTGPAAFGHGTFTMPARHPSGV